MFHTEGGPSSLAGSAGASLPCTGGVSRVRRAVSSGQFWGGFWDHPREEPRIFWSDHRGNHPFIGKENWNRTPPLNGKYTMVFPRFLPQKSHELTMVRRSIPIHGRSSVFVMDDHDRVKKAEELWEYSYHMGYQIMGKPNVYHDYGLLISHDN